MDLTEQTQGNALGIGLADLITKRLYPKIDFTTTYANTITTTFLDRARIPIVVDYEKDALEIALKTIWNLPETEPRIILIKNTLKLNEIYVSKNVWEDVKDRSSISALNGWKTLSFDEGGKLMLRI